MKFFGTEQDCRDVREAYDFACGMPFYPGHPAPATPEQNQMIAAWLGADQAGKAILESSGAYNGWSLHQMAVYPVDPPGFGWYTELPDDVLTIQVPACLNLFNRTLSLARLNTLIAARAVLQEDLPVQWAPPIEE